jgi:hypothetical protein
MKWYDPTECDNTADPFVADVVDLCGVNPERLWTISEPLTNWDATAFVQASDPAHDGDPDDVLQTCLGMPIYSARLRKKLSEAGVAGVQYLPIRVLRPTGEGVRGDFAIANILTAAPVLDLERSEVSRRPDDYFLEHRRGSISGVRRPVLRRSVLEGHDILRPSEWRVAYYVSERFRNVFWHGFTGCSFREVELSDEERLALVGNTHR